MKLAFHPGISLVDLITPPAAGIRPPVRYGQPRPPQTPRLVAEALGTGTILAELSAILAARFWVFREDGAALSSEKRSGQGIHYFLAQLTLGVEPILGLERVTLVRIDPNGMVHFMHFLFSVRVNIYSTSRHIFVCLVELPAEGLPLVVEIPHKVLAARGSVCTMTQVYHVTHIGGISPLDYQTRPCNRAGKTYGADHRDLACPGFTFVPPDCTA